MAKSRDRNLLPKTPILGKLLSEILQTLGTFHVSLIPTPSHAEAEVHLSKGRFMIPLGQGLTLLIESETPVPESLQQQIKQWIRINIEYPKTLGTLIYRFASMVPTYEDLAQFYDAAADLFLLNLPFQGFIFYEKILQVFKIRAVRYLKRRKIHKLHEFPFQTDPLFIGKLPEGHPFRVAFSGKVWEGRISLSELLSPWLSEDALSGVEHLLGWKSLVILPISYEGQTLGLFILGMKKEPPDPLWRTLLNSLQWFVGFNWWRGKVMSHLHKTQILEQGLRESVEMAIVNRPIREVATHILNVLLQTTGAFKASFYRIKNQALFQTAQIGFSSYYVDRYQTLAIGHGLAGRIAEDRQSLVVQDALQDSRTPKDLLQHEGFRSYIGFPILHSGALLGVVEIFFSKPYEVTPEVLEITERVNSVFGVILEQSKIHQRESQRLHVLERLQEVQKRFFSTLRLEGVVSAVQETLSQLPQVRKIRFYLVHKEEDGRIWLEKYPDKRVLKPTFSRKSADPFAQCIQSGKWVRQIHQTSGRRRSKTQASLYLPIQGEERICAILHIEALDPKFPSDEDQEFFQVIQDALSQALRNVELYERSLKVTQDLDFMYTLLQRSVTLNFEEFLEVLSDSILSLFQPDAFLFAHVEENEVIFDILWEEGQHLKAEPMSLKDVHGLTGFILEKQKPLLLHDAEVDSPVEYYVVGKVMKSYLGVPILANEEVIGVISVQSQQPEAFTSEDLHLLEMIANTLANVIQNILIHKREQASRYFLDTVLNHTPDWIIAIDREGKIIYSNPQSDRILGMSPRVIIGRPLTEFLPESELDPLLVSIRAKGEWGPVEFRFTPRPEKPREQLYLSVSGSVDPGGKIILVVRDVTREHDLEIQLRKAGYLSAVGELAAGVAHEINNPLTAVIGLVDLWLRNGEVRSKLPKGLAEDLQKIRDLATKASVIAKDLLSIAGAHRMDRSEPFELNRAVDKVLDLFDPEFAKYSIEVVRITKENPIYLMGREGEIQQVFINLLLNAKDAMVSSRVGDRVEVITDLHNRMAILEVRDNGPGIPKEYRHRIFDPFFSTKPPGKGTGLGLALSMKIAQEHGGTLEVESKEGQGATFRLILPVQEVSSDQVPQPVPRILFADKDQSLIRTMEAFFNRNHVQYRILTSGEEFFEYLATMDFDLVLIAEDLPNLSFRDEFLWLKQRRPDMRSKIVVLLRPLPPPDLFVFLQKEELRALLKPISPELLQEIVKEHFEDEYKME